MATAARFYLVLKDVSTYQEEHNAHSDVGKDDAHPDFISQRVEERKDPRLRFLRLLDHDGDSQGHEGFGEVNHLFPDKGDGQGSNGNICFLDGNESNVSDVCMKPSCRLHMHI